MKAMFLLPLLWLSAGPVQAGQVDPQGHQQVWTEKPKDAPLLANVPDFRKLVKESIGAVVNVSVDGKAKANDQEELLQRFFGQRMPHKQLQHGLGSGFVISADGYVLTNAHVVENADTIKVKFPDDVSGDEFRAKVVGLDSRTDVALLKIDAKRTFPFLALGNSSAMEVGDWVLAIGNPFGLAHSVSAGIVSARDRRGIFPDGRQGLYDFIQTDASINPGNSGGPLLNMHGEVIGINAAVNPAGQGLGFAVPINMAKAVIGDLHDKGRVARAWIGVQIQGMDGKLAKSFGLDRATGALVGDVVAGGPGEKAGLHRGDVILEFDGKIVHDQSELPLLASQSAVGKTVALAVQRDGKKQTVKVTMGEMPGEKDLATAHPETDDRMQLGLRVQDITPQLAEKFELRDTQGVVVSEVVPGSGAEDAGLQAGDRLTELNGKALTSTKTFVQAVRGAKSGDVLRLLVKRGDAALFVALAKP